jgi:hypothetical protein
MTRKDIAAAHRAGTELAWNDRDYTTREPLGKQRLTRVQILQINATGQPAVTSVDNWRHRAEAAKRTVQIRLLDNSLRRQAGDETWTESRTLLATWTEYIQARAAREELAKHHREIKARKDELRGTAILKLDRLLADHGLHNARVKGTPDHYSEDMTTAAVTLTLTEVQQLLAAQVSA